MKILGRNDKCSCGSGKKYKQCCMLNEKTTLISRETHVGIDRNAVEYELQTAIKYFHAGRYSETKTICQKLLGITPNNPEILYLLGVIAYDAKSHKEAFNYANQAKILKPSNPFYQNLLGSTLFENGKIDEAVIAHRKAISLKPDFPEAYYNLGNTYLKQKKFNESMICFRKAISIKPNYAEAYHLLANTADKQGEVDVALDIYYKAYSLNPNLDYLVGEVFLLSMTLCKWDHFNHFREKLQTLILSERLAAIPFTVVTLTDSPNLQRKAAEIYVKHENTVSTRQNLFPLSGKKEKIHIGYFSPDFGNHPVTHLIIGLIESRDKNNFEISAFSFGAAATDKWKERLVSAVDHFVDVREKSDEEVAALSRSMGIDIAVDLTGYTSNNRPFIFAERAAPIQVSYLGYLGTLGAEYIDYLISTTTIVPESNKEFYKEKLAYIPNYMSIEKKEKSSTKIYRRSDFDLPDNGIVFCSFNSNYKITPDVFSSWIDILKRVDGSVLWLFVRNNSAIANLKSEAEKQGFDISRIVFAEALPQDEHLSRLSLADIFLDTYPCNAGATACDALRMGVPLLTRVGETFASRIAASLLDSMDSPELITTTKEEYENLAVDIATDKERLVALKKKFADNSITSSLFDKKINTKYIEAAYTEMYERYCAGLKPDHIKIF